MAALAVAVASVGAHAAGFNTQFLYGLSDTTGALALSTGALAWDWDHDELYVIGAGNVDVFNDNGMRIHSFGGDAALGTVVAIAPTATDLFVLVLERGTTRIVRCDFRGAPRGRVDLAGVPASFQGDFVAGAIASAGGNLYLADRARMKVLVVTPEGRYVTSYELHDLLGIEQDKRANASMRGFSVDRAGNILFTVSELFAAYLVSPDGALRSFGSAGSVPGKFNVVGGIVADERGRLYVTDVLRAVVMVFDRETLAFQGELGHRGRGPGNLVAPLQVIAAKGRVYVSQSIGAVKVFGVRFE